MSTRLLWALYPLAALLMSACYTTAHTTTNTENDPIALAQSIYWTGVFWTAVVVAAAVSIVAWAIAYATSERAKYGRDHGDKKRES